MAFREMMIDDLDRVAAIEAESFSVPWSRDAFEHEISVNSLARYFVLEVDGDIVSYCGMWVILDEAHITNIASASGHRRKGYARELLLDVEKYLKENGVSSMTLEVRASNERAISLYAGIGFASAGIRPGYYEDNNEDAVIMWKNI